MEELTLGRAGIWRLPCWDQCGSTASLHSALDRFGLVRSLKVSLTGLVPVGRDTFALEVGDLAAPSLELGRLARSKLKDRARLAGVAEAQLDAALDRCQTLDELQDLTVGLLQTKQRDQKLLGALLSFTRPSVRYSAGSEEARSVAESIAAYPPHGQAKERWDELEATSPSDEGPILLILDRMDDPVTPLLAPFTYDSLYN